MKTTLKLTEASVRSLKPKGKEYVIYDAECEGLAIRVQPTGAKSWVCWKRIHGKTRRMTLGSLKTLDLDGARWACHVSQPYDVTVTTHRTNTITFADLAEVFVKAKRDVCAKDTLYCLCTYLNSQLVPAFGRKQIHKIKTSEVVDWFEFYSQRRPGGANEALGLFRRIVEWGKRYGLNRPLFAGDPEVRILGYGKEQMWKQIFTRSARTCSADGV